ncbi:MAG: hypothetical protein ACO3N6_11875 [bacterium]
MTRCSSTPPRGRTMKAQFLKTIIKAAAIVALATSIANCGAMPEESITETTYQPSSQPTAPADPEVPTVTDTNEGELVKDGCEAFGLVYDEANNTCVNDEHETNIINPPATLEDYEYLNFTVTPGERKLVATWTVDPNATSYTIEHNSVGAAYPTLSNTTGSTYTFATTFCTPKEFKLVANMTDGSTVESSTLGPFKPTNCE